MEDLENSRADPKAKIVISIVHAITTSIRGSIRQKSGHRMVLLGTLQGMARGIERQPHILRRCVRSEMKDLNQDGQNQKCRPGLKHVESNVVNSALKMQRGQYGEQHQAIYQ